VKENEGETGSVKENEGDNRVCLKRELRLNELSTDN
jgi:hypothetical protein